MSILNVIKEKIINTKLFRKLEEKIERRITKYAKLSYSQHGEDMLIDSLIDYKNEKDFFYVDIGAHHPMRFSSTYYFYKKGWNGINIDACPGSMEIFNEYRPRDINLELCISDKAEEVDFYIFEEGAYNTFDKSLAEKYKNYSKLREVRKIRTVPINSVLEKYLPRNKNITFLNIDIEGIDVKVLRMLDFGRFNIKIIVMEKNYDNNENQEIKFFLKEKGYNLVIETHVSMFFLKNNLN